MTATYGQAKDVLAAAVDFHRDLKRFYNRLAEKADRERVKMVLDYMGRHEKDFESALAEMGSDSQDRLLETWMQYAPDDRGLEVPRAQEMGDEMMVDDVVEVALEMDEKLANFYAQAAKLAKMPEVKHLFGKLAEQQEDKRRKSNINAILTQRT